METSGTTVESYEIALLNICLENWKTFAGFAKYWQLGPKGKSWILFSLGQMLLSGFCFDF